MQEDCETKERVENVIKKSVLSNNITSSKSQPKQVKFKIENVEEDPHGSEHDKTNDTKCTSKQ